jgi:hypothetical protein
MCGYGVLFKPDRHPFLEVRKAWPTSTFPCVQTAAAFAYLALARPPLLPSSLALPSPLQPHDRLHRRREDDRSSHCATHSEPSQRAGGLLQSNTTSRPLTNYLYDFISTKCLRELLVQPLALRLLGSLLGPCKFICSIHLTLLWG